MHNKMDDSFYTQSLNIATLFILSPLPEKITYLPLNNQKITILPSNLKFSIYTTFSLKYFLPYLKTNLQMQIIGEKTKFNPQTIN